MPDMRDEITSWENGTKKHKTKYYLTMFLQEAYKISTELPVSDKGKFSKFCDLHPKNVLLLKQSPADQCKCKIHENLINNLKLLSILHYSGSFWDDALCNNTTNSQYWQWNCEICADDKKVIVNIDPGKLYELL